MINAPPYQIAKFLISVLQPVYKKKSSYCIKDFFSFVDNICNESVIPDKMCSFDIKSLFTNVPLEENISICLK